MITSVMAWIGGFVAGCVVVCVCRESKSSKAYREGWEGAMEFLKSCLTTGYLTVDNLSEYLRVREKREWYE